jgi:hypothetical protein
MKEEHESIIEQTEQYVKTSIDLYTLKMTDKIATVISSLVSKLAVGMLAIIVLFMLTMGFSLWIGNLLGNDYMGFLIIGALCALLTWIVYRKRNSLIKKPLMDTIINQILK